MAHPVRLLIVDDDPRQLRALCDTLSEEGFETECVQSAAAAVAKLTEGGFDILLSDLRMPGTDGIELVRKALALDPDLVPVLVTGHGSMDSAVQAMQVGALDYTLKPFKMDDLRPVLTRAVAISNLRRQNRRLQRRLEQRTVQLEAANRELEAFAGRIAHDLREPMNIVRAMARLLAERRGAELDAEAHSYLRYISEAAERADHLIKDLLEFARLGNSPLATRRVDLNDLLHRARRMIDLNQKGSPIEWHLDSLPVVNGDESLLQQVFVNLLSNARKYSRDRDPPKIEVTHELDPSGAHRISVRDNGVGFNPAQSERLFTPFQRLHRADQFEGHGMGLANVKRIVERHGGSVSASSVPGAGAVFTVVLPAHPGEQPGQEWSP